MLTGTVDQELPLRNEYLAAEIGSLKGQRETAKLQERATGDEQRIGPLASERCEGVFDVAAGIGMADLNFQSHAGGGTLHLPQRDAGICGIQKHGDPCRGGHKLTQELQPLRHQLLAEEFDAGRVAAGPGEAN